MLSALQRAPLSRVTALAEALLEDPPSPDGSPPAHELWPLVNARASLLSRPAQGLVDAPAPAGLNLTAAMNPRHIGSARFSNGVMRALLYSHGLVIEDPLVMAADLFCDAPEPTRAMARAFVEAAAASLLEIAELLDAGVVLTFFFGSGAPVDDRFEQQMLAALDRYPAQSADLWDAFEAGYVDGLSPNLRELWRRIRAGDRYPSLGLVKDALEETDADMVRTFVDVVSTLRPQAVLHNTASIVASAAADARRLGARHDLLCASPLFARLLFLGSDDPVAELRVSQLARTPVPSLEGLGTRDVVAMRRTGEAFQVWRSDLSLGLERAHRLREELGPDVDVAAVVSETLADARHRLRQEAQRSATLGRQGWLSLVAGSLGAAAAATVVKGPRAAALAAAGGGASSLVQRMLATAARRDEAHVGRHYLVFERPLDEPATTDRGT